MSNGSIQQYLQQKIKIKQQKLDAAILSSVQK